MTWSPEDGLELKRLRAAVVDIRDHLITRQGACPRCHGDTVEEIRTFGETSCLNVCADCGLKWRVYDDDPPPPAASLGVVGTPGSEHEPAA